MNIKNGLYHQATGLPWAELPFIDSQTMDLRFSAHAKQAAINDRYGLPQSIPSKIFLDVDNIFEIEVLDGRVEKFAVRIPNGVRLQGGSLVDLILVCSGDVGGLYVRTLWFNVPGDSHSTLNKSNYVPYAK